MGRLVKGRLELGGASPIKVFLMVVFWTGLGKGERQITLLFILFMLKFGFNGENQ